MTGDGGMAPDGLDAGDAGVSDRLTLERPVPSAGFRGELARYLSARDPGYGPRPPQLWLTVSAYLVAGALLLLLGLLQALGSL
jgi:hypothetical protein